MTAQPALRRPRTLLLVEALETRELPSSNPLAPSLLSVTPHAAAQDRLLVRFHDSLAKLAGARTPLDFSGLALGTGMRLGSSLALVNGLYEVQLTGVSVPQALASFMGNPLVAYAQPDFEIRAERLPNDPNFGIQWGLRNTGQWSGTPGADINAQEGWDHTTGTGRIIVAVLDSGIDYNHPDLAPNMWRNPGEAPGSPFQGSVYGWNFVNNTPNPMDDNGHGTHVAGIIGAVGNNGLGVTGVAWNVQLMAVKILNFGGSGFTSDAIRGLNFAVSRGAKIANNSWGGAPYDPALANAIQQARTQGMIFVAAAGNQARNIDVTPFYPASYPFDNVVRVAATDNRDLLASFSNFGVGTVQLAAPGVSIVSTSRNGGYVSMSGTSMAAPMVAGALALVWDQNPGWTYHQVIQRVLSTVDPIPALATRVSTGGRLNLGRALAGGAPGGGGGGGGPASGAWVTGLSALTSGSTITGFRVSFNEAIQASTFTPADITHASGPHASLNITGVIPVSGSATQFDVTFAPQSTAGTYRLTLGPHILNAAGVAMDQNRNSIAGEEPGDQFTGTVSFGSTGTTFHASGLPANLPDVRSTSFSMSIGSSLQINNLAVRLNVTHTWVGDLLITLRGPMGQTVTLVNRRGGSGQGLQDTTFSDFASVPIGAGTAPFLGIFRPETPLAVFNGTNVRGFWTLTITDQAAGNTGRLNAWSLIVNGSQGASSVANEEEEPTEEAPPTARRIVSPPWSAVEAVSVLAQNSMVVSSGTAAVVRPVDVPAVKPLSLAAARRWHQADQTARAVAALPPRRTLDLPPVLPQFAWAAKLTEFHEQK